MSKKVKITIDKEKCKGCMLCISVCPQKILIKSEDVNSKGLEYVIVTHPEKCTGCGSCYTMCPDSGIEISEE